MCVYGEFLSTQSVLILIPSWESVRWSFTLYGEMILHSFVFMCEYVMFNACGWVLSEICYGYHVYVVLRLTKKQFATSNHLKLENFIY